MRYKVVGKMHSGEEIVLLRTWFEEKAFGAIKLYESLYLEVYVELPFWYR